MREGCGVSVLEISAFKRQRLVALDRQRVCEAVAKLQACGMALHLALRCLDVCGQGGRIQRQEIGCKVAVIGDSCQDIFRSEPKIIRSAYAA